jgi:uncharacterized phosphosugar-binding protein
LDENTFDNAAPRYLETVGKIIQQIAATQLEAIERAAQICANSIVQDGVVFCWGSGHSRMPVEELFPRIGSFPGFLPIVELAVTHYTSVVGANGLPQTLFLERLEGYAEIILSNYEFHPHDSMICFSNSGINAVVVEMVIAAKQRGLKVIGVGSGAHAENVKSRHASSKSLAQLVDVFIDNCTPLGDAVVELDGLKYPVGPTSTVGSIAVVNALKARTAELMLAAGVEPVVLTSPHFVTDAADTEQQMRRVYDEFKRRRR